MAKVFLLDSPSWMLFNPTMHLHLGILYIAGNLRKAGHDVQVLDCHKLTSWDAENQKLIIHEEMLEACDVVGFSSTTANLNFGIELAQAWKKAKVKVLGGPHVTHIIEGPHEKFKRKKYFEGFDYLMYGECEEAFVEFCNAIDKGIEPEKANVPGLVWFNPFGMQKNAIPAAPEITKLPAPAFDLWSAGFSKGALSGPTQRADEASQLMTASLYTARGCPYGCKFCADARTKLREETDEQIESQVKQLAELGVRAIRVQDDTYSIKVERCRRIADILFDYGMVWRGTTRVNLVDKSLFKYLASRGCTELGFGIEHGSNRMLKLMEKGTTAEKNEESLAACADAGIVARAFLMVGFPGETVESIEELKAWLLKVRPSAVTVSLFQPYPGSEVWNYPERFGVRVPEDAFSRMWQLGMDNDPKALVLELPTIKPLELFKAKRELVELIEREIGSLDRMRLHGNVGTYGPAVSEI